MAHHPDRQERGEGKIGEVLITDPSWQEQHHKSLYFTYKRAKHFSSAGTSDGTGIPLEAMERLETISRLPGITTQFVDSRDYSLFGDRIERLVSLLEQLDTTEYVSGPTGRDCLADHVRLFSERNIALRFKDYSGYPSIPNRKAPARSGLSSDMLWCAPTDDNRRQTSDMLIDGRMSLGV